MRNVILKYLLVPHWHVNQLFNAPYRNQSRKKWGDNYNL